MYLWGNRLYAGKRRQGLEKQLAVLTVEAQSGEFSDLSAESFGHLPAEDHPLLVSTRVKGGVGHAPVDFEVGGEQGGAFCRSVVTDGDGNVDRAVHDFIDVLGVQALGRNAHFFEGRERNRLDYTCRPGSSAQSFEAISRFVPQQGFSHLRAAGIACTNKQNRDS